MGDAGADNTEMDLKELGYEGVVWIYRFRIGESVPVSFKHGKNISVTINGGQFLEQLTQSKTINSMEFVSELIISNVLFITIYN